MDMTDYDELFAETAAADSLFADKQALDPLREPDQIVAREPQQRQLARLLNGVHEGFLPTTISIYGPPGTGKTITTRRVCREFAARTETFAYEYVNLKECRSLFSAANEIHLELTGDKLDAYEGLDGVFEGIWTALDEYPEWTVLILDEIDHIRHDSNYDPNDFFYRLLRGEGKLQRDLNLSVVLVSNELLEVDLRLDSRVQSAMDGEEVFFPPYGVVLLERILRPRVEQAFRAGAVSDAVLEYGVQRAAWRWGDVRKALRLFRKAGETAMERGVAEVTQECLDANIDTTDKEALKEKVSSVPRNHFVVLMGVTGWKNGESEEIIQPVTTADVLTYLQTRSADEKLDLSERAVRDVLTDLETMGLVDTWIESRGRDGRVKQIEATFDPQWIAELLTAQYESTEDVA
jgi:orc1/cdc6 family replication initiation protein